MGNVGLKGWSEKMRKISSIGFGLAVVLSGALDASLASGENHSGTTTYVVELVEKADLTRAYSPSYRVCWLT